MKLLITALVLAIVGVLVWKLWKPFLEPPLKQVEEGKANLYFFYTEWCGFSKKAQPEWTKLEDALKGSSVTPIQVNCETDRATCSLYGVEGYPTVVLETKKGRQTYPKRITEQGLLQFLHGKEGVRL